MCDRRVFTTHIGTQKHTQTNSATSLQLYRLDLLLLLLRFLVLLLLHAGFAILAAIPAFMSAEAGRVATCRSFKCSCRYKVKRGKGTPYVKPSEASKASPLRPAGRLPPLQYSDTARVPGGTTTQIFCPADIYEGDVFHYAHIKSGL